MDILILIAFLVITFGLIKMMTLPANREVEPPRLLPHSETLVIQLTRQLTGIPDKDKIVRNRILALGQIGIPVLFSEMIQLRQDDEAKHAQKIAIIESMIADFGVGAVPAICQQLNRSKYSSLAGLHAHRIIVEIGTSGAVAALHYFIKNQCLIPEIYRYVNLISADQLAALLSSLDTQRFKRALEMTASRIHDDGQIIEAIWQSSPGPRRVMLLKYMRTWPTTCLPSLVENALCDQSADVRAEAINLATLTMNPRYVPKLTSLTTALRPESARALAALDIHGIAIDEEVWRAHLASNRLHVAASAMGTLILSAVHQSPVETLRNVSLRPDLQPFADAFFSESRVADWRLLLPDPAKAPAVLVELYASVLAYHGKSAGSARERLIRLAELGDARTRTFAVKALAHIGDPVSTDLLVAILKDTQSVDGLRLQQTAQCVGQSVTAVLARRLHSMTMDGARLALSIVRTLQSVNALASLLHALEDSRDLELDAMITATLYVGDRDIQDSLRNALMAPERGLLLPTLSYMYRFASEDDLPLLLDIYDDHVALRSIVLNMIEQFGTAALDPLRARIERGGDDNTLLPLEHRLDLLNACLNRS